MTCSSTPLDCWVWLAPQHLLLRHQVQKQIHHAIKDTGVAAAPAAEPAASLEETRAKRAEALQQLGAGVGGVSLVCHEMMWLWINTYENTIFRGMNIHKSQLF